MKKLLRILGFLVLFLVLAAVAGVLYFNSAYPVQIPKEDFRAEATPERLKRGEYLAHHVTGCVECHSTRNFQFYAGPVIEGTLGMGGEEFNLLKANVPGRVFARNITPAGIGNWTDGEVLRAITCGVSRDNSALFPLMPYKHFALLAKEDQLSIIAYIRTLPSIENKIPERTLDFPMNFIVKTIPSEGKPASGIPDKSNTVEYGKYLVNAASCIECHTKSVQGKFLPGMEFAGGFKFTYPNGDANYSANITPDKETGIGLMSKETFIGKFKSFVDSSGAPMMIPVAEHQKNTVMPWTKFGGMTEEDLGAIYEFLRSVAPVHNEIKTFVPAGSGI